MEPVRRDIGCDLANRPRFALVGGILDHFQLQTGWVIEPDELLSEPLLDTAVLHLVVRQVFVPELGGPLLHRIRGGLDLTRSRTAGHALVREGGVHRARFRVGIGVIQVVMAYRPSKRIVCLIRRCPKTCVKKSTSSWAPDAQTVTWWKPDTKDMLLYLPRDYIKCNDGAVSIYQYGSIACKIGKLTFNHFSATRIRQRSGPERARPTGV